jgi:hypothetical protein
MNLFDYIYVDLNKVISLYSQMTGGVVEMLERSSERAQSSDNKRNYDFKVFKHNAGGTQNDSTASKETIKPHHALLKELEASLEQGGHLLDLRDADSLRDPDFRARVKSSFCVRVRGRALIEDYERMKGIARAFPDVLAMINKSVEANLTSSADFVRIKEQIEAGERAAKMHKDRNVRAREIERVRETKRSLDSLVKSVSRIDPAEKWILDGLQTWIDTFLSGIVNLRVYAAIDRPDEHILGHLKPDCFEEDTGSFHFTYGSRPTEEITLIGIVTSVPDEIDDEFNPLAEFDRPDLADTESFEKAFRGLFRGFDGMERMIRTCRFPRVLVHPIAVYRSVSPN